MSKVVFTVMVLLSRVRRWIFGCYPDHPLAGRKVGVAAPAPPPALVVASIGDRPAVQNVLLTII